MSYRTNFVLGETIIASDMDANFLIIQNGFADKEIPTGLIDSSNTVFTLAHTPNLGSEHVFLNGLLQLSGAGNAYTISGVTITFNSAPTTGSKLVVSYRKIY